MIVPLIAGLLAERAPEGHIRFEEGSSGELIEAVRSGRCAAAFSFNDFLHPSLEFVEMFRTCIHVGLPRGHKLAARSSLHLETLENEPYIFLDSGGARAYYSGLFDHHGIRPATRFTVQSGEMARQLVARSGLFSEPDGGDIVRVPLETDYCVRPSA